MKLLFILLIALSSIGCVATSSNNFEGFEEDTHKIDAFIHTNLKVKSFFTMGGTTDAYEFEEKKKYQEVIQEVLNRRFAGYIEDPEAADYSIEFDVTEYSRSGGNARITAFQFSLFTFPMIEPAKDITFKMSIEDSLGETVWEGTRSYEFTNYISLLALPVFPFLAYSNHAKINGGYDAFEDLISEAHTAGVFE